MQINHMKDLIKSNLAKMLSFPILIIYFLGFSVLILAFCMSYFAGIPLNLLMRDILATTGGKLYTGIISNLGALIWTASASVTLFAYFMLRRRIEGSKSFFLIFSSFFTLLLLFDDFFMLHEFIENHNVFPVVLLFAFYGVVAIIYLWENQKIILQSNFILLFLALSFFALSILMDFDLLISSDDNIIYLIEDGAKFLGIISWATYHILTASSFFPKK